MLPLPKRSTERDSGKHLRQIILLMFVVVGALLLYKLFISVKDKGAQQIDLTTLEEKIQNGELKQAVFKPQEVAATDKSGQEFRASLANEFRRAELMRLATYKDMNGRPKIDEVAEETAGNSVPWGMIGIAAFVLIILICGWWWWYGGKLWIKIIFLIFVAIGALVLYKFFSNPQGKAGQKIDLTAFEAKIQNGDLKQIFFMSQEVVATDKSGNEFVIPLSNEFRRAELMKLATEKDDNGKPRVEKVEEVIADSNAWLWGLLSVAAVALMISAYGWRWLRGRSL